METRACLHRDVLYFRAMLGLFTIRIITDFNTATPYASASDAVTVNSKQFESIDALHADSPLLDYCETTQNDLNRSKPCIATEIIFNGIVTNPIANDCVC